jgi:hypothetical protein
MGATIDDPAQNKNIKKQISENITVKELIKK